MSRARILPAPLSGMHEAKRPTGAIVATIIVVAASYGSLIIAGITYSSITGSMQMPWWMSIVAFGGIAVLIGLWVRFKEGRRFRSLGFEEPRRAPRQILWGVAGGLLLATLAMLTLVLLGQGSIRWNADALTPADWLMALVWIAVYAVQSSSEEIAVRGFAAQAYARRFGIVAAIALQAVLFAALHAGNDGFGVLPIVNMLLLSVALGLWVLKNGSLWSACAFHSTWNWALSRLFGTTMSGHESSHGIFVITPSADGPALITGGTFGIEGSLITAVLLAAMIAVLARPAIRRVSAARAATAPAGTLDAVR